MSGGTKSKQSKNQHRRAKKKAEKKNGVPGESETDIPSVTTETLQKSAESEAIVKTQLPETTPSIPTLIDENDPLYDYFKDILGRFRELDGGDPAVKEPNKPEVFYDDDDIPEEEDNTLQKLSKKKRKEQNKLSIAELKALVAKPELVDWYDPSSQDPRLLVGIKAHRNVVPVPAHWSLKREYLSSKRGIEKPPFALPKFIAETGITEMRDAVLEKQEHASLKQRQRERVQPKMGKLDVDYQRLYEAFFRFQTKPELTRFGEVYYEGKEYEANMRHLRPGEMSDELKEALNIPPGAPPPWLINQQRFGPPPSYPALRIPGLNAPIPPGAQWGYHPGGYGKPPVDENNKPLFGGDIYGVLHQHEDRRMFEPVNKDLWGELKPVEESEEEEDEEADDEEEEADEEDEKEDEIPEPPTAPSKSTNGVASMDRLNYSEIQPSHGEVNLRKPRQGTETEEPPQPRAAGRVIPEQQVRSHGFFGSDRAYDLRGTQAAQKLPTLGVDENKRKRKIGDVDVSVDVDALQRDDKLSKEQLQKQYEAQRRDEQGAWGSAIDQDDLSEMIASESAKRLKKDEERRNRR